jgi:hypothetical protein
MGKKLALGAAIAAGAAVWLARDVPAAMGGQPSGQRLDRIRITGMDGSTTPARLMSARCRTPTSP